MLVANAPGSAFLESPALLGFMPALSKHLLGEEVVECDVLVTGTSQNARTEALKLVEATGLTGWDAGPIENSVVVEGLTSVLININKRYGSKHAGIRITGASSE